MFVLIINFVLFIENWEYGFEFKCNLEYVDMSLRLIYEIDLIEFMFNLIVWINMGYCCISRKIFNYVFINMW